MLNFNFYLLVLSMARMPNLRRNSQPKADLPAVGHGEPMAQKAER
jgi:hypothetical protein